MKTRSDQNTEAESKGRPAEREDRIRTAAAGRPRIEHILRLRGGDARSPRPHLQHRALLQAQRALGNRAVERQIIARQAVEEEEAVLPVSPVSGTGTPEHDYAYADGELELEGRTDADFDGGSFRTVNVVTRPGENCPDCEGPDCLHVTGTLVSTFHVTTTVTLPSADDFPGLTPCQRRRVQDAIRTVLAPHEQEHVQEFRRYNGTVRTPFDLTVCRSDFATEIQALHDGIEETRQDEAQAASDALDPFHFTVDLDCEEEAE